MQHIDGSTTAILSWLASVGASGVADVAAACGLGERAVQAKLRTTERDGLTRQVRLLHDAPALHLLTRSGLRAVGRPELGPVAVSAAGAAHQHAVARVAAALAREHGAIHGERELRALERAEGRAIASAELGYTAAGSTALHRPDLVCFEGPRPVAIEVELTVKAPRRLRAIVRAWARSRLVAGVVYYASPHAARAVAAARRSEQAEDLVVVLALDTAGRLPDFDRRALAAPASGRSAVGDR